MHSERQQALTIATKAGWDPQWIRDAQDVAAVLAGCRFDTAAGEHPVEFFRTFLRHSKGQWAGQPFELLDWQADATRRLFGWKRADGTRRYRKAYIEVPKKNGKSTWLAGLELYLFVADDEPGAEVYCVAVDKDQALIVFNEAATMVRQSPDLRALLDINETHKTITYVEQASKFRALSADVAKQEGLNIHGLCFDELHAQKKRAMWDTLIYGGAARRQPMQIAITTAGVYDPSTIGWEQHERARQLLAGVVIDWAHFALVFAADTAEDWTSPDVWARVNPSWGITINPETFAEECRSAQLSATDENNFRRYRLNQWVQQVTRWIPLAIWDENHVHPIDEAALLGRRCDGGLDLGSVGDLSACALLFECPDDPDALDVLMRFWIPEGALTDERNRNRELYAGWVKEGLLEMTPGPVTNQHFIKAAILKDAERFDLRSLAVDRLFQGQQLCLDLADEGIEVFPLGQGYLSQGPPMKEFERRWKSKRVHHGAHPILRWMADNAEVKPDPAGNLKLVKPNHHMDPRKIDGIQAVVNAVDRVSRYNDTGSVWESDDYEMLTL